MTARYKLNPGALAVRLLIVLVVVGGGVHIYSIVKARSDESSMVMSEIGKLVILPEGEDPTIISVDSETARTQGEFFSQAQVGDKVLLFPISKKAILYRPTGKKIIAIAPITS